MPANLATGTFDFLNRTEARGRPVNWEREGSSLLWLYHLHYFEYLHLLLPAERERICLEWLERNPAGRTVGWDAYPTSRRIVNWVKANLQHPLIHRSLYRQAAHLFRHQEVYLLGNHLLANAKALLFAGQRFSGRGEADAWLRRALELLRRELPEQILPDGGHYERSPMYHALTYHDLFDVINVLGEAHPDRPVMSEAALRMTGFLRAVTHPDGRVALFNDATQEIAPPTEQLLEYARAVLGEDMTGNVTADSGSFRDSGYYIHRSPKVYLIVDGGKLGPDYLLAHAHADIFSFELSLSGRRFVVDQGCYEYAPGPLRDEDRGTPSHNTVTVDGKSQAECWGAFRVARRFPPRDVDFRSDGTHAVFRGVFDGYARLIGDGITHRREIHLSDRELRVEDLVEGTGHHVVESRLRLHPEIDARPDGPCVRLIRDATSCSVRVVAGDRLDVLPGRYSPEFGQRRPTSVLVVRAEGVLPLRVGYVLEFAP